MPRPTTIAVLASVLLASVAAMPTPRAAEGLARTSLTPFNVITRVFDPAKGMASGQDEALPVDSPDDVQVAASTLANTVSFTSQTESRKAFPAAFTCVDVEPR